MNGWTNQPTNQRTNERTNKQTNERTYVSKGFSIAANWGHLNNKAIKTIYKIKTYYNKIREKEKSYLQDKI